MVDKKVILIFFILLMFIVVIVGGLVWFLKSSRDVSIKVQPITTYSFLLRAFDQNNNHSQITAGLVVEGLNKNFEYSANMISEGYTRVDVPVNDSYKVSVFKEGYYTKIGLVLFIGEQGSEVYDISLVKAGSLNVSFNDTLKDGTNLVKMMVQPIGVFRKAGVCFSWTSNVVYASFEDGVDYCSDGWLNWSVYYDGNNTYEWLPKSAYRCGSLQKERVHACLRIEDQGRECVVGDAPKPLRIYYDVDHCYDLNYTFDGAEAEKYLFNLKVKAVKPDVNDYVKVLIMDKDRYYVSDGFWFDMYEKIGEKDSVDVGSPDQVSFLKV